MITTKSVGIKNLRSLENTGHIELKPITILVGRNSSGKSTFARTFPLLRQSTEVSKRGPILWWGRLVDFGSFNEAVSRSCTEKEISFEFKLSFEPDDLRAATRRALGRISLLRMLQPGEILVKVFFKNGTSSTYTSRVSLSIFDFQADFSFDEQGFVTDIKSGLYNWKPTQNNACYAAQDRLIPNPSFFKRSEQEAGGWESFDPFRVEITRAIRNFVHGNTAEDRVRQLANKIPLGPRGDIFRQLMQISNPPSFRENLRLSGESSYLFRRLCDLAFVSQVDVIFDQVNSSLNTFFGDVIYLEPLRATAQRYYRQQSLAVGEIDSKGENIAMFLDSLSYVQHTEFKKWTAEHFGIEVAARRAGGHISLAVKQLDGGAETNIADMGFGFSQMLPIAAQLWAAGAAQATLNPYLRKATQRLIVIEQPELHLHPDYQAKLANVFAAAIARSNTESAADAPGVKIIAETHSPSLINRLGELVASNRLNRADIQVVLFEQDSSAASTKVTISEFDEDGILRNWPIGFFEPELLG